MNLDLDPTPLHSGPPLPYVRPSSRLIAPVFKQLNFGARKMLKEFLSAPLVWLWASCIAIAMSSTPSRSLLVAAQSTSAGGSNETLSVLDSRITYEPEVGKWDSRSFAGSSGSLVQYVSISEFVLENTGDGTLLISPKVSMTFRASALHYLSPIFPFNTSIGVSVDNRPQQHISLLDNSTARPGGSSNPDSTEPSGVRTFTLAGQLDASTDHTVVLSSHAEDDISFMHVGQFILATPASSTSTAPSPSNTSDGSETALAASLSSGKKLKIILPVAIIGSLIAIAVIGGLVLCHLRSKKAARGTTGQHSWGWDATPLAAPAAAFARRFSRHGSGPQPPPITPFSPGSEESALKDPDDFESEYVEATAFKRKPSAMSNHDMAAIPKSGSYGERMQSFGSANDPNTYVPARLTQENLQQLANNNAPVPVPVVANVKPPPIVISQRQKGRDHRSVVSAANTAEMLVRDIPYLPYLHTVAQPSENGHSRKSQPTIHAPVPLVPQRRSNQSSMRPHQPANRSDESYGSKTRASPGLYPTYLGSADPTAAAIIERGEQDVMLTSQKTFKPRRRRSSGDSSGPGETVEGSNQGYGSTLSSHASQPPVPPPKPSTTNHPAGGRRQHSLRRKAVPTIQELEASSTSTLDRHERPPSAPPSAPPSSSQSHSRVTSDSSVRPRPLPQTPTTAASVTATNTSPEGSTTHHSTSTHARHASPPPSSYHASSGHDLYGGYNPSSSRRHEQRPSGGRSQKGGRSSGGSRSGKEKEQNDPVWYPDRAANSPPEDDFDDMYVDEENPQPSPSRVFVQGSSSR